MATQREEIAAEIGLDNRPFVRGLKSTQDQVKSFGKSVSTQFASIGSTIGAAFAVSKVVDFGKAILDLADNLQAAADRTGASVEFIQGFNFAASQTGVKSEAATQALDKLSQTIGDAANGSKQATTAFAALGISIRDGAGNIKATSDIYLEIADAIRAISDPATRTAIAMDLFGKSGAKLVPLLLEGAAGFNKLSDSISKLSKEDIKKLDELGDKFSALKTQFMIAGGFGVLGFLDLLTGKFTDAAKAAEALAIAMSKLPGVSQAFPSIAALGQTLGTFNARKGPHGASATFSLPADASKTIDPEKLKAFAEKLAALDAKAQPIAEEIRRLFSQPFKMPREDLVKEQVGALKSVDEQIQELIRKASEEGLVIQPKNSR